MENNNNKLTDEQETTRRQEIRNLFYNIWRNHPDGQCTFGKCNKCDKNYARGSQRCDECLVKELEPYSDNQSRALEYVQAIETIRKIEQYYLEGSTK